MARRPVEAHGLRDVHDVALDALGISIREVERVVLAVVRPGGGIDPHVLDVHHVGPVDVDSVGVRRVARDGVVDRAVGDVHHPRVVDVHVGLAAARGELARVRGEVEVHSLRPELAVGEGEATYVVRRVVELEDVVVRVDPVAEEVHPVQQELLDVGKLERSARCGRLDVRVLRGVRSPRRPRRLRHELPHRVGRRRHPHDGEVRDVVVGSVRNRHGCGLRRPADDVARVVQEVARRRRQGLQRLRGGRAVPRRAARGVDVHHVVFHV